MRRSKEIHGREKALSWGNLRNELSAYVQRYYAKGGDKSNIFIYWKKQQGHSTSGRKDDKGVALLEQHENRKCGVPIICPKVPRSGHLCRLQCCGRAAFVRE